MKALKSAQARGLRVARAITGQTRKEFGETINLAPTTYSDKELGKTWLNFVEIIKVLQETGQTFEDLFLPSDYDLNVVENNGIRVRRLESGFYEVDIGEVNNES